jgi:transposase
MDQGRLFDSGENDPGGGGKGTQAPRIGPRRVRFAVRDQVTFQTYSLDELVPAEHEVRMVWEYVWGMDLSELYAAIQAVEGGPGQAPGDPRILLSLWLYATLRGVGSARELNRLCTEHVMYRWICGGVTMNYHTLSDVRTAHVELLDRMLTESAASLVSAGLATLDRVAQDGVKVRASAGASSFRRKMTLEEALAAAEEQVASLGKELDADPGASKTRQQAARQRAAAERAERIRAALLQLPEIEAKKKAKEREKARAWTTDADARVMKMGDGGYRPAYNVQVATATGSQVITGVEVTNSGGDQGQMAPMVGQHEERYGEVPKDLLADGGFAKKEDIEKVSPPQGGTTVYAPVMKSKDPERDAHTPRPGDGPAVAEWRQRMGREEAKAIYRERAATAECVNAQLRNRGLRQFLVRGLRKVKAVVLWYALAHNLMRAVALRASASYTALCNG